MRFLLGTSKIDANKISESYNKYSKDLQYKYRKKMHNMEHQVLYPRYLPLISKDKVSEKFVLLEHDPCVAGLGLLALVI